MNRLKAFLILFACMGILGIFAFSNVYAIHDHTPPPQQSQEAEFAMRKQMLMNHENRRIEAYRAKMEEEYHEHMAEQAAKNNAEQVNISEDDSVKKAADKDENRTDKSSEQAVDLESNPQQDEAAKTGPEEKTLDKNEP
jgi:hypothetical protein